MTNMANAIPQRLARSGRTNTRHLSAVMALLIAAALLLAGCGHDSNSPRVANAPGSGGSSRSTEAQAGKGDPLAYSKCMRDNGIKDFPDPNAAGGGYAVEEKPGSDLNPKNPRFKAAEKACKSLAPQAPPDSSKMRAANLKYSKCMRDHGVKDFPDPNSDGQINLGKPGSGNSDLTPDNPTFQAAGKACQKLQGGGQTPISGGQGGG